MTIDYRAIWAPIAKLFRRRRSAPVILSLPVNASAQDIRNALAEIIKEAVDYKDVHTLALLAGWFAFVSEDATIARFRWWVEHGQLEREIEPPSSGGGDEHE